MAKKISSKVTKSYGINDFVVPSTVTDQINIDIANIDPSRAQLKKECANVQDCVKKIQKVISDELFKDTFRGKSKDNLEKIKNLLKKQDEYMGKRAASIDKQIELDVERINTAMDTTPEFDSVLMGYVNGTTEGTDFEKHVALQQWNNYQSAIEKETGGVINTNGSWTFGGQTYAKGADGKWAVTTANVQNQTSQPSASDVK